MSGRLTPAAATWISTSPARPRHRPLDQRQRLGAAGLGRHDGLHGEGMGGSLARLIDMARPSGQRFPRHGPRRTLPDKPNDPLIELGRQDLDPMSIEELHERIEPSRPKSPASRRTSTAPSTKLPARLAARIELSCFKKREVI